jgi:hypothetical protein
MLAEIYYMSYFIELKKKKVCLEKSFQHGWWFPPFVHFYQSSSAQSRVHREPFFIKLLAYYYPWIIEDIVIQIFECSPLPFFLTVTVLQRDARSRQNLTSVSQLAKRNPTGCCSSAIFNTQSKTKTLNHASSLYLGHFIIGLYTRFGCPPLKTYKKKRKLNGDLRQSWKIE